MPRQGSFQDGIKYLLEKFEVAPPDESDLINEDGGVAEGAALPAPPLSAAAAHVGPRPPLPPEPMAAAAGVPAAASVDSSDTMGGHDDGGPPAAKRVKDA